MSKNLTNSIFQEPWWLDAVAGEGNWDEVYVEEHGSCKARMPFCKSGKSKSLAITMPLLTQTLGPAFEFDTTLENTFGKQKELTDKLIQQLPKFCVFSQRFHYSITNWLPWYWNGFKQTTRYTYILDNLTNLDAIWKSFDSIRQKVRKAENKYHLIVECVDSVDAFLVENEKTFARQNKKLPYDELIVKRIDAACSKRNCRKILFAKDIENRVHSAIYIVWNEKSTYYLMSGSDPQLRKSASNSLLLWEAIKFASTVSERFDFEGSMIEPIERSFRSFGTKQIPYMEIYKVNSRLLRIMKIMKEIMDFRKK